ncbi:hypothetical protein G9A89_012945 [Geosiphon pyriformis]|nr:hypothetical protein G9A89_012945 [Geosiphon pyriformis]
MIVILTDEKICLFSNAYQVQNRENKYPPFSRPFSELISQNATTITATSTTKKGYLYAMSLVQSKKEDLGRQKATTPSISNLRTPAISESLSVVCREGELPAINESVRTGERCNGKATAAHRKTSEDGRYSQQYTINQAKFVDINFRNPHGIIHFNNPSMLTAHPKDFQGENLVKSAAVPHKLMSDGKLTYYRKTNEWKYAKRKTASRNPKRMALALFMRFTWYSSIGRIVCILKYLDNFISKNPAAR